MIDRMLFNLENQDDSFIRNNIWMKECRFLLRESRSFRETQMLLVSNNSVFSSCRLCYNCLFSEVQVHFFCFFLIWFFFYVLMNLFVLRLVMNLVMCMEAAMRNIQHVFIALCDLGVLFLFLFFFLLLFSFYRESPEKLWILFSDTVLSTRVVNISPAQKNTKQTICFVVSQQIKKVLLFYFHVFCWFLLFYFYLSQRWFVSHFPFFRENKTFWQWTNYLFVLFQSENNTEKTTKIDTKIYE